MKLFEQEDASGFVTAVLVGLVGVLVVLKVGRLVAALLSYVAFLIGFHLLMDAVKADPQQVHRVLVDWKSALRLWDVGPAQVPEIGWRFWRYFN